MSSFALNAELLMSCVQRPGTGEDHQQLSTSLLRTIYIGATRQELMLESLLLKQLGCCLTGSCLEIVQDEIVQILNLDLQRPAEGVKRCPGTQQQLSCFAKFRMSNAAQWASKAYVKLADTLYNERNPAEAARLPT